MIDHSVTNTTIKPHPDTCTVGGDARFVIVSVWFIVYVGLAVAICDRLSIVIGRWFVSAIR